MKVADSLPNSHSQLYNSTFSNSKLWELNEILKSCINRRDSNIYVFDDQSSSEKGNKADFYNQ